MFSFPVNKEAEDHFSTEMAQRMFHESGQEGRSGEAKGKGIDIVVTYHKLLVLWCNDRAVANTEDTAVVYFWLLMWRFESPEVQISSYNTS